MFVIQRFSPCQSGFKLSDIIGTATTPNEVMQFLERHRKRHYEEFELEDSRFKFIVKEVDYNQEMIYFANEYEYVFAVYDRGAKPWGTFVFEQCPV